VTTKERLLRAVLDLPETEVRPTLEFIASRREDDDDFARWLASHPEDDEPLTDEEQAALAESAADIAAGRLVSFEEIKREFGYGSLARRPATDRL
jgi:predicted transcriptional regulator